MLVVTMIAGVPLKGRTWVRGGTHHVKPWAHTAYCACDVDQTFTCDRCGRRVGWCLGCHDEMPGACDFCWRPPMDDGEAVSDAQAA